MQSTKSNLTLRHRWPFDAIGTLWLIETSKPIDPATRRQITDYITTFDTDYSRFRSDSTVGQMALRAGTYTFSPATQQLLDFYKQLYEVTSGAVTPMVGDALVALGYDEHYSFTIKGRSGVRDWNEAMYWQGSTVTTNAPVVFDVGAAGKGYLIDQIGRILNEHGYIEYVIDGSGDVLQKGALEQVVGLEDPNDDSRVIGIACVKNGSICASATNRRKWGDGLHHIINARSGKPESGITATWVMAESAMVADGLATALFFCEPITLSEIADFQYVRMNEQGIVEYSSGFVGELFI